MNNKLKVAAEFYLKKGWNIIPLNFKKAIEKKGKIEKQVSFDLDYKQYHTEKVTPELTNEWWGEHNGMAIVTGKVSGITVIDIDTKVLPEIQDLPLTFTVETNKGFHFYFKYAAGIGTKAAKFEKDGFAFNIDIRNDGGIVYAAPCEYELPNGSKAQYKIIQNLPLMDFPFEWGQKILEKYGDKKEKTDWKTKAGNQILPGERNATFTSIIGGLLQKFPQDDWNGVVWSLIQSENQVQKEPLGESELRTIFNSIAKKELQKRSIGGDIKDILTEVSEEEIRIKITLEKTIVCFKIKNYSKNLLEGTAIAWLEKGSGLSHEMPFYFKLNSDSNKEQWARIMSRTFDKKDEKEIYPWTLLVTKAGAEIEKIIKEHKQTYLHSETSPKQATWLLEPFIQEDQINTLFGLGSSGKTMLALYFASLIAENNIKTLIIDYENDSSGWSDKMQRIAGKVNDNFIYFDSEQIPIAEQVDKIKDTIRQYGIKLVIVDSASMASGESTSDEKAAIRLISALKLLKITTLLIAHQRKNEGDRNPIGSIQYENQSRNVWNVSSERDGVDDGIIHIACKHTKANNTYLRKNPVGFKIAFGEADINISEENAMDNFEEKFSVTSRIQKLLSEEGKMLYSSISERLALPVKKVSKFLSQGKNKGIFINDESGLWSLS